MPHTAPALPVPAPNTPWPVLAAPAHWQAVDFISDLHLQPSEPATAEAWQLYLRQTRAQAVFILGDLFEAWVGDDVLDATEGDPAPAGFEAGCARSLREVASRLPIFFLHGNRDFLLGEAFAAASGVRLLHDPTVLLFGGQRWLLSHGDALCLDDRDYMRFRAQVRSTDWRNGFLAQPLAQRRDAARALRAQSRARQHAQPVHADLDALATLQWLAHADAGTLIHGHTHRPGDHDMPGARRRIVLSDWDLHAHPPRAEVLRLALHADEGVQMQRLTPGNA